MDLNRKIFETEINGTKASLEISDLAGKADGAVIGHWGDTVVLATVVMSKEDKSSNFFPLAVDYEEKFYAAGKILGSRFIRREGRPSDEAVLSARLIDRTIRPLFDHRIRRDIQVTVTVLAYDEKHDPDVIALLAVSTALGISNIPWGGPVAGVGKEIKDSDEKIRCSYFMAGTEDRINMIELEGVESTKEETLEIFESSQREINQLVEFQKKIISELGKPKEVVELKEYDDELLKIVQKYIIDNNLGKAVREKTIGDFKKSFLGSLPEEIDQDEASEAFEHELDKFVRKEIIENDNRPDGRGMDEVRELHSEVGLFRRTHGSGLFIRGETQILAITTLASPAAEQLVETMEFSGKKGFMLHYNFPSFSAGEAGRSRSPGRREIGHGALAAKAISNLLPSKEEFPYTIRIVAETLSSNGSTSMASTCAASLSLMDAGVPIKSHAAGIAMGLITSDDGKRWKLLTDIQGPEDHHGDMDLKVAGTERGITAIQMDVKIEGITKEIFKEGLVKAEAARIKILETMNKAIPSPRPQLSEFAPSISVIKVPVNKIGAIIGPGGKNIQGIIAATENKVEIDISQEGEVFISSHDQESARKAIELISQITKEYKPGEIVEGTVVKILEFGAIIDLGGDHSGMIHVSELKDGYVKKVEEVLNIGDTVKAKILRIEGDKMALSLKSVPKENSKDVDN